MVVGAQIEGPLQEGSRTVQPIMRFARDHRGDLVAALMHDATLCTTTEGCKAKERVAPALERSLGKPHGVGEIFEAQASAAAKLVAS